MAERSAPPANTQRRGVGCLLVMMSGLAMLGMIGVSIAGLVGASGGGNVDDTVEVREETHPDAKKKLAIVEVRGILVRGSAGIGRPDGATGYAMRMLDRALEDEDVAGVLLHLDTPGGSVTDSDLLHQRVKRLREQGKPVLVHMGDLCASGGYYTAVAANEVWALPTTITGSIGVIIQSLNVHELLEKHGVRDVSITSGKNKAMLSPTRPMSPEQRRLLQDVVDALQDRFVDLVAEGRKLDKGTVERLADGRIFTAEQAKAEKLIDDIGYRKKAVEKLKQLSDGGPFNVVRYSRRPSFWDLVTASRQQAPSPGAALLEHLAAAPRAMYLYAPFSAR